MTSKITQEEINAILWKACDTFRGTVDPSEYKNYILVMLFVKYISDVWHDHYETYKAQYGRDAERIKRRMDKERFKLPAGCDFDTLYQQRNEANLGEIINIALEQIEEANKEKLSGVFRNIDFNSEANLGQTRQRNERLQHLLADFADKRLDLRPSRIGDLDVIGNAYEYLIGKFAASAGKKAGEFYTPPEVSQLLARLVAPKPGERLCDPACGSGSLLIKCAKEVENFNKNMHVVANSFAPKTSDEEGYVVANSFANASNATTEVVTTNKNYAIYGQESNGSTWALCMMNMFLHDVNQPRIEWGDTLKHPQLLAGDNLMRFDVVVANPPFSLDKWGAEGAASDRFKRFHRGVPPKSKGDYAFITHMIETTDVQTGRVGVIVPHGVLFRGSSEGKIRKKLIEENLLDAVIGLPTNLFYGTGIPAAILIFRRDRSDTDVLFIDASREFEEGTNQNKLREADLDKIVTTYNQRQSVDKYAYRAQQAEIEENDYNLNIPRYVDTFEEEAEIDLPAVQQEIDDLEQQLRQTADTMSGYLKELGFEG